MKEAGGLLIALGILAIIAAFFVTTSTHVGYMPSLNPYASALPSDVVNLYGVHVQAITFQGGFAAIIAGVVLVGFGTVDETLKRNAAPTPKAAPPPPPPAPVVPANEATEYEEEKPDHSMIWIAVLGLGAVAIIIVAMLAAQSQSPSTDNNAASSYNDAMNDLANSSNAAERAAERATNAFEGATRGPRRSRR